MPSAASRRIRSVSYAKYGYLFILPFFAVYCFFQIWPLINTFILSFQGDNKYNEMYVGLDNFKSILMGEPSDSIKKFAAEGQHEDLVNTLGNTVILWVGNFIPQIAISLALAVWFTDAKLKIPGKGFFKVVMYLPNILTAASVAALFLKLFDYNYGIANKLLYENLHWVKEPIDFTGIAGSKWAPRFMIMFIQAWMWFGNTMIMLMSGIMGLNPSLFEAANIDGASSGQVFRKITLPLLRPIMLYTLITSMIGGLQMFDIPKLYNTSNTKLNENTKTIAVLIYDKAHKQEPLYGQAATYSVVLFVLTVALGSLTFFLNRDKDAIAKKKERKANLKALKAKEKRVGGAR